MLVTVRTIPRKLGMVLTVTSTRLDSFVLEKNQPPLTSLKMLSKYIYLIPEFYHQAVQVNHLDTFNSEIHPFVFRCIFSDKQTHNRTDGRRTIRFYARMYVLECNAINTCGRISLLLECCRHINNSCIDILLEIVSVLLPSLRQVLKHEKKSIRS